MATNAELNKMTHKDMLWRINRGDSVWHYQFLGTSMEQIIGGILDRVKSIQTAVAGLPKSVAEAVLAAPIKLQGTAAAKGNTTITTTIGWVAHNFAQIVSLLTDKTFGLKALNAKLDLILAATKEGK